MLEDCGAKVLLTQAPLTDRLGLPGVPAVTLDGEAAFGHFPTTPPHSGVTADDLAYVIYTSGTTGGPRGR